MAWRAFVDEQTPEGLHVIFTNDDSLDATTIREAWDAPNKAKGLRRFGKVARLDTQADVEAFCKAEIAALEAGVPSDIKTGAFVDTTPTVPFVPDAIAQAEIDLSIALNAYEKATRIQTADPAFDIAKYKQAVVDAQTSLDALK